MSNRFVTDPKQTITMKMHRASFVVMVDAIDSSINIEKDRYGVTKSNVSIPELLRYLSGHLKSDEQKTVLEEFAIKLDKLKCFM